MRLLSRPQDCPVPKVVREVEAAGWEIHLEAVEGPEACVRARDLYPSVPVATRPPETP